VQTRPARPPPIGSPPRRHGPREAPGPGRAPLDPPKVAIVAATRRRPKRDDVVLELRRELVTTEILEPGPGDRLRRLPLEIRWDPLTGQSCRILPPGSLPPPERHDLDALAAATRESCPFCPERIDVVTPRFSSAVGPEGRIRRGAAVLFPNLVPYAKWSSVSVYSPELHALSLEEVTPALLADNLAAQVEFGRAVLRHDPSSRWLTVNANQLPPSGSSIFHPHLQGSANPFPTTVQRLLADGGGERLRGYLELEREAGERLLGSTGRVDWLAAFAPVGPAEVRGLVAGATSPEELDDDEVAELADGCSRTLRVYASLGFQSFNLALYGVPGPAVDPLLLVRLVARAYFGQLRRSDAMWSERLHWEAATDLTPEAVSERGRRLWS
jgi:UDPglucose--hexose-1-phosphate uridylyltransferase